MERPVGWVTTVATRMALRSSFRARRGLEIEQRATSVASYGDGGALEFELASVLDHLPRQQRAAVALSIVADLPIQDVARHMRCSVSTARVHLHRGRTRLAQELAHTKGESVAER